MNEALQALRLLRASLDTHGITRYDYRVYWSETLTKTITALEVVDAKPKDSCLICKHREGCRFADSVREMSGLKSNEMWFFCFQPRDDV